MLAKAKGRAIFLRIYFYFAFFSIAFSCSMYTKMALVDEKTPSEMKAPNKHRICKRILLLSFYCFIPYKCALSKNAIRRFIKKTKTSTSTTEKNRMITNENKKKTRRIWKGKTKSNELSCLILSSETVTNFCLFMIFTFCMLVDYWSNLGYIWIYRISAILVFFMNSIKRRQRCFWLWIFSAVRSPLSVKPHFFC